MAEMTPEEYDFIIIGGGTSGLVVARRLTEDPNIQVLVLEAGADGRDDPRVKTPALFETLKGTEADWGFETEAKAGLNGRRLNLSQGRLLGGSSAINASVFVPPSKTVIDAWERLGNPGWNWNTLRLYYTKSCTFPQPGEQERERLGINWKAPATTGPIKLTYSQNSKNPLPGEWIKTFESMDCMMEQDPFSGESIGAFTPLSKSIVFQSGFPKVTATGVNFQKDGKPVMAMTRREVILAAGSLQSPKILELSGIGDAKLLRAQGIEVIVENSGVGENLQSHLVSGLGFEANDDMPTLDGLVRQEPKIFQAAMGEYLATKTGSLGSNGDAAFAFLPLVESFSDQGAAELKKILDDNAPLPEDGTASKVFYDIVRSILEDKTDASAAYLSVPAQSDVKDCPFGSIPGKFVTLGAMLSMPLSRGSVHINSPDVTAKPTIDPRFLSNPIDLEILARHMHYIDTIAASEPFSSTILKKGGIRREPKWYTPFKNLDDAKSYVRARAYDMWHPTSTSSMMPRELGGVVDTQLIVYGTSNLRVVDAGIMPIIPRANIQLLKELPT